MGLNQGSVNNVLLVLLLLFWVLGERENLVGPNHWGDAYLHPLGGMRQLPTCETLPIEGDYVLDVWGRMRLRRGG